MPKWLKILALDGAPWHLENTLQKVNIRVILKSLIELSSIEMSLMQQQFIVTLGHFSQNVLAVRYLSQARTNLSWRKQIEDFSRLFQWQLARMPETLKIWQFSFPKLGFEIDFSILPVKSLLKLPEKSPMGEYIIFVWQGFSEHLKKVTQQPFILYNL